MSDALLRCRSLSAAVEEKSILSEINLEVPRGEVHVLMGPNGAGKSTLGHVLMGDPVYDITAGEIVFDGEDITDLSPEKRSKAGLFLSFQAPVEIPGVPLRSFLRAIVEAKGQKLKNKQFRKKIEELADTLDMDRAYLDRELGVGFSGGEKKKVEMLQLLLLEPKLAILDETDSGLDVDATARCSSSRTTRAFSSGSMSTACMSWFRGAWSQKALPTSLQTSTRTGSSVSRPTLPQRNRVRPWQRKREPRSMTSTVACTISVTTIRIRKSSTLV